MASKADVQKALNLFERGEEVPGAAFHTSHPRPWPCDLCRNTVALVDGKTHDGGWAYMCCICFAQRGIGLGPNQGTVLLWGNPKV